MKTLKVFIFITFVIGFSIGQEYDTVYGKIRGSRMNINGKDLEIFHGIPFAKPPIGNLRFQHPVPLDPWTPEVKDATREKPSCIQTKELYALFSELAPPDDYSEDCLYLSMWKPENPQSKLAVMVWIYGGGFTIGTTRSPEYNGQYLAAENDVIVISINYRVGPLGFAYLGPDTIPGNMGLMDQVMALRWVKENIEYLGGDSNRITIFGESAGSMSVGYHLLSDMSMDLFNNGILQSGAPTNSVIKHFTYVPRDVATASSRKLAEKLNCTVSSDADIKDCLMKADPLSASTLAFQMSATGDLIGPVVDNYFIAEDPHLTIKKNKQKKTNILAGVTKNEATLFFTYFLNVQDKTLLTTGEVFAEKHLDLAMTSFARISGDKIRKALKTFYVSQHSPPLDALKVADLLVTDATFRCPTHKFSSVYSQTNSAYVYSLNYRYSTTPYPEWMGVPHGYDIALVFGIPLNDSLGYNQEDKDISRKMMTYWTNFAKTGNPNSPVPVTVNWPVFDRVNQTYMALDGGSNLAAIEGFRRHECTFMTEIIPMISMNDDKGEPTPYPDMCWPSSASRGLCSGCFQVLATLLLLLMRALTGGGERFL